VVDTLFPVANGVQNSFGVFENATFAYQAVNAISSLPRGAQLKPPPDDDEVIPPPITPNSRQVSTFETCGPGQGNCSYLGSNTIGARDLFQIESLSFDQDSINAIEVNNFVRQNPGDLQNRRMFNILRTNEALLDKGAARSVSTRYQYKARISSFNPSLNLPWNPTTISNAQFGVEMATNGV